MEGANKVDNAILFKNIFRGPSFTFLLLSNVPLALIDKTNGGFTGLAVWNTAENASSGMGC
jgi:hypothetical protein